MKVAWSDGAVEDLHAILLYVAVDNVAAAFKLVDRLEAAGNGLTKFPRRGRTGREPGTRELVVPGTKYIIIYELNGDRLEIIHVMHGARQWPPTADSDPH
jgi:addiction module RelE/StbE family toxin